MPQSCSWTRTRRPAFLFEVWIQLVELSHLAIGSPTEIAVPGFTANTSFANLVETARRVESCSELVGERRIVDEAVCMR